MRLRRKPWRREQIEAHFPMCSELSPASITRLLTQLGSHSRLLTQLGSHSRLLTQFGSHTRLLTQLGSRNRLLTQLGSQSGSVNPPISYLPHNHIESVRRLGKVDKRRKLFLSGQRLAL